MIALVSHAATIVGEREACKALGVSRATYHRRKAPLHSHPTRPRSGGRALSQADREAVLAAVHEPRFADLALPQVHAKLLEEGTYLCSLRTMYRILDAAGENRERRDIRRIANATKPELLATKPNELWSWDISVPQKAAREMRAGPSQPACRSRSQTTASGLGQKPWS